MIANRTIRFPAVAIFSILLLVCLAVTYFMVQYGILVGLVAGGIVVAVLFLAAAINDYNVAFYAFFLMGIFMFYVDRVIDVSFPMGTVYDALVGLAFFTMFLNKRERDWSQFRNPVTVLFLILIAYQVLQLFNPSANSVIAWLVSLRNNISFLIYVICFQMFFSLQEVKKFTMVWLGTALVVALYGIYQKLFG